MNEIKEPKPNLWTSTILIATLIMVILFVVTAYIGFTLNLLWCVGLGLFYGIALAFSYYFDSRKKQSISLMYVIQAAVVFVIILIFVWLQRVSGPNPYGFDYLILAFSMLFAGGMFGIPAYRYSKIKLKAAQETES